MQREKARGVPRAFCMDRNQSLKDASAAWAEPIYSARPRRAIKGIFMARAG